MKYPKLTGICKYAIEKGLCTGCNKLEDVNFIGVKQCNNMPNVNESINFIRETLGMSGEQLKL